MGWRDVWRWLAGVLVACAAMLSSQAAVAQALPGTSLPVCVARIRPGDTPAAMIGDPAGRYTCKAKQTHLGAGDYWVLSGALPPHMGEARPVDIRFATAWQDRLTLYALYTDGKAAVTRLDGYGLSRHLRLGAIVNVRLPNRHIGVTRVLWRIDGAQNMRGVLIGATAATPMESAAADLELCAIYAGFAGLCLTLLIYNLALWAAMRQRFQFYYCAMVASLIAYASSNSGVLAWLATDLSNNDRLRFSYATLTIVASTGLVFARSFFEPRIFRGWLDRLVSWVIGLQVAVTAVLLVLAPVGLRVLDHLYALSFLPVLGIVVPALWRAWRLKSDYRWQFGIAWGAPLAMMVVRIATNMNLFRWNIWIDNSTILSMAIEAMLFSLAIAYRVRLLSVERDQARAQESAARLLADTDPLTGLLNRRAFLHRAIGREGDQTLLILDIDHFKSVNETIGHDGGDEVLRVIARGLRAAMPPDALVARIGGEEFAAICEAANAVPPSSVLDRLRAERMPFDVAVTSSIGACTGPLAREVDWKALYRRADLALFAAKAAGRDRARDATQLAA